METTTPIGEALTWLQKANADLEPELLTADAARVLLADFARAEKLASFGKTVLARKLDDVSELARVTGTAVGKAKETIATGKVLEDSPPLREALKLGEISMDQASEIARAEESAPGVAPELLAVAQRESFSVLREKARRAKLEAEQHRGLGERQSAARCARSYGDELGMVHVHPSPSSPTSGPRSSTGPRPRRAGSIAEPKQEGRVEPFERHLADAYASLLAGGGRGIGRRPEARRAGLPRGRQAGLE